MSESLSFANQTAENEDKFLAKNPEGLCLSSWINIKYNAFRHFEAFCKLYSTSIPVGNISASAIETYFFDYNDVHALKKKIILHVAKEQLDGTPEHA